MSALPPRADMLSVGMRCPLSANSGHKPLHRRLLSSELALRGSAFSFGPGLTGANSKRVRPRSPGTRPAPTPDRTYRLCSCRHLVNGSEARVLGAGARAALIRVKLSRGAFRSPSPIWAVQPRSLEAEAPCPLWISRTSGRVIGLVRLVPLADFQTATRIGLPSARRYAPWRLCRAGAACRCAARDRRSSPSSAQSSPPCGRSRTAR